MCTLGAEPRSSYTTLGDPYSQSPLHCLTPRSPLPCPLARIPGLQSPFSAHFLWRSLPSWLSGGRRERNKKAQGCSFKTEITWGQGHDRKPTNQPGRSLHSLSPLGIPFLLLRQEREGFSWSNFCWCPVSSSRICAAFESRPGAMEAKNPRQSFVPQIICTWVLDSSICPSPLIFQTLREPPHRFYPEFLASFSGRDREGCADSILLGIRIS